MSEKMTNDDRHFGPITYGRSGWNAFRMSWSSGGKDDGLPHNHFSVNIGGWCFRFRMPNLIRPLIIKNDLYQDWRKWYYEFFQREFGLCLCDGHLSIYYGAQTNDSTTTKCWSCFLPWTQWRRVRFSLYDTFGNHYWTEPRNSRGPDAFSEKMRMEDLCPSVKFLFSDFDGSTITATTRIEEREWLFGTGSFKWLSWFRRSKVRRSLDLKFDKEVGSEKGSWKGGIMRHGIDMLPGELHEQAFRRYCDMNHGRNGKTFRLTFLGRI